MGSRKKTDYSFLATLGLLAACTSSPEKMPAAVVAPATVAKPAPAVSQPAPCGLPAYNVEQVSAARESFDKTRLSNKVVQQMVRRSPRMPALFKSYFDAWELYGLDTVRCPNFILIAYFYRHEDCCEDIYYLTFTNDKEQKLIDWADVAKTGADGTWGAKAKLRAQKDGRLLVTTLTDDGAGDDVTTWRDSVTTAFAVATDGHLSRTRLDSTRTTYTAK
jgi:hypothetical protein